MFRELADDTQNGKALAKIDPRLHALGAAANQAAADHVFIDYRSRRAANTLRRQDRDLGLFAEFLQTIGGVEVGDLANDPDAWNGITWGLAAGFQKWQLSEGYAIGSINVRMSTVKKYAKLALQAGTLDPQNAALITAIEGYSRREGKRIDEYREAEGWATRVGDKKEKFNTIGSDQAKVLITALPDTPQGRRDRLLVLLMFEHGLRVGEVEVLEHDCFDLRAGTLTCYRPKVDKTQALDLNETPRTLEAARAYITQDAPTEGIIWRGFKW